MATQTGGTWDTTYDTTDVEADITVACDEDGTFTPYKFSAWYGYDKDCTGNITSFNSSIIQTSTTNACAATITQTYYHNGSGSSPAVGDECYINQNQTTALAEGYYKLPSGSGYRVTGTSGTVASLFACVTLIGYPVTATNYSKPAFACYQNTNSATVYLTDSNPVVNTTIAYSNSAGTTFQGVGNWGVNVLDTQSNYKMTVGSNGVITFWQAC